MPKAQYKYSGVGRRKTSVARIYMNEGEGNIVVNKRKMEEYFPVEIYQLSVLRPFKTTNTAQKFDVNVRVVGGGISGQAEAVMYGVSKALLKFDPELRSKLKVDGLLTRDARIKERKKYGQPGARKRFQYSKR